MDNRGQIAWAAGLFEGEGSIGIYRKQEGKVLHLMRLQVTSTDLDVLQRFCEVVACGKVSGERRFGREHYKPAFTWVISNRTDIERILLEFRPWFGNRRGAKADEALAEIAKLNMVCGHCGKQFRSHRISSKFCSSKCRSMSYYLAHRPVERPSAVGRPRTI